MPDEKYMRIAIEQAKNALRSGEGMAFGAVIVKGNEVISMAQNTARKSFDPTNHAEINAIRKASQRLQNHHLIDCTLYTTCEPCPMCFAAAWWAKIPKIVYCVKLDDVKQKGQREIDVSCEYLNEKGNSKISIQEGFLKDECMLLYK